MKIDQWKIAQEVARQTEQALLAGEHEVFVIWTSIKSSTPPQTPMDVDRCIVPAQKPGVTDDGVWVHIEGGELQRIQIENFREGRRSVIQLHTHPGADVRMSQLDRTWEVVRHVGALSIIVPYYGRCGLLFGNGANIYEREEDDWRLWSAKEVQERLVIA